MKLSKFLFLTALFIAFSACKQTKNTRFTLNGNIKGLTKGTVYLEEVRDTLFVPVDSCVVRDDGNFTLGDNLDSPQIYYLKIKEKPQEKVLVFGEKGEVHFQSNLEHFTLSAKVQGSTNHDLLATCNAMVQKFNDKRLDIFKANILAEKAHDSVQMDSLNREFRRLERRKILYITNYAVKHADKEVAPYIALTKLYNAKISLLDTVNNSLTDSVKASKYGRQLEHFISVIKNNEGIN